MSTDFNSFIAKTNFQYILSTKLNVAPSKNINWNQICRKRH